MQTTLEIITITKDDLEGVAATILSTKKLRACPGVRQIIIDGSEEYLQKRVMELLIEEENIDYIPQESSGIAHAFNQGINSSHADWLWFLNGRDEIHPDLDELFFLQLLNTSQAEVIICEIEYMQTKLRCNHPSLWALWPPLYWMPHPATLIKRRLFDKYGSYSQEFKIAMDGDLWIRFFTKNIVVDMLSIPISLYDNNGISSTDVSLVLKEADKIIIKNYPLLFKVWVQQGSYLIKAIKRYIF